MAISVTSFIGVKIIPNDHNDDYHTLDYFDDGFVLPGSLSLDKTVAQAAVDAYDGPDCYIVIQTTTRLKG